MTDRPVPGVTPRAINHDEEPVHAIGPAGDAWIAHGLLFRLNQMWAHAEGFEFVLLPDGQLGVKGDGSQLRNWAHIDPSAVDGAMRRSRQVLLDAQGKNKVPRAPRIPSHGHQPETTGDVSGVFFPFGLDKPTVQDGRG